MAGEAEQPLQGFAVRRRRVHRFCGISYFIPFLFLSTIVIAFLIIMQESLGPEHEIIKYTTVTGYFEQDDSSTDPKTFDYAARNFGLIDRRYSSDSEFDPDQKKTQWQRFENQVSQLNAESSPKVQYKVLYMGRHGEGYHNLAEAFYGTKAWDCYWSLQDGNGTITWSDALLTPAGVAQAQKANQFWHSQILTQKLPTPESYYTSPLLRCMATALTTFSGLKLPLNRPFIPTIKELFRESIGAHTCDRRSSKSVIHANYPTWPFEEGFEEEDPLWSATERETDEAHDQRSRVVLDDVFSTDDKTYISISSHSGQISSILRVIGHREFGLETGQVIPVLVKAEKVMAREPPVHKAPWTTVSSCTAPPPGPTM